MKRFLLMDERIISCFRKGDLVRFNTLSKSDRTETGLVLDVNPRNVYDNESCDILTYDKKIIVLDIKYLSRVTDPPAR